MKNSKDKIRMKAGVLLIVWTLLCMSIGSVLSGTVTNDDINTTTDDSDLEINYQNNWIRVDNISLNATDEPHFNGSDASDSSFGWDLTAQWNVSDNNITKIGNSNGNYYDATGDNIQLAINDCDNTTGSWIKLAEGNYTTTANINLWYNVTLDMMGSQISPTTNTNVITVYPLAKLTSSTNEGIFNCSEVITYNSSVIVVSPYVLTGATPLFRRAIYDAAKRTSIEHISIISANQQGTGLDLTVDANQENIGFCIFNDLWFENLWRGIYIHNDDAAGFINGNYFTKIRGFKVMNFIVLDEDQNEISGNIFDNVGFQPHGDTVEHYPINLDGNCDFNIFDNIVIWDWAGSGDSTNSITIGEEGNHNYFFGVGFMDTTNIYYDDNGIGTTNTFISPRGSRFQMFELNTSNINRFAASDTKGGVRFYQSTDENPYTYFYGDVTGTARYGAHRVDLTGNWDFITGTGDINFAAATGITEINNILKITPQATAPDAQTNEACIYYHTGNNTAYMSDGTVWNALW